MSSSIDYSRLWLVLFGIGCSVGWFGSAQLRQSGTVIAESAFENQLTQDASAKNGTGYALACPSEQGNGPELIVEQPSLSEQCEALRQYSPSNRLARLVAQLANGESVDNLDGEIDQLFTAMVQMRLQRNTGSEDFTAFRKILRTSPKVYGPFLDKFITMTDLEAKVRVSTALMLDIQGSEIRDPLVIDRIVAGNNSEEWLEQIAQYGMHSKQGLQAVLDYSKEISDAGRLVKVLRSVNRSTNLGAEISNQLTPIVEPLFDSENPEHRAAAVASLPSIRVDNKHELLTNALKDSSDNVVMEAIAATGNYRLSAVPYYDDLMALGKDEDRQHGLRAAAVWAIVGSKNAKGEFDKRRYDEAQKLSRELEDRARSLTSQ